MIRQPGFLFVQGSTYYGWQTVITATNGDAVMLPKGTGALIAAIPDSAVAGGNARGANAVDWQSVRTTAAQVASGLNSVLSGGLRNTASGVVATAAGGADNSAGDSSWAPGGRSATTRVNYGRGAWAAGSFATSGDAQAGEFVGRALTTNATVTRITADGSLPATSTNSFNLPNNGTYMLRLIVTAQQTAGASGTAGDCAGWELTALIKRGANAAATVLVGSSGASVAPAYNDSAALLWRVGLAADTTTGGLAVSVTGEASKTVRWVARIMSVETTA